MSMHQWPALDSINGAQKQCMVYRQEKPPQKSTAKSGASKLRMKEKQIEKETQQGTFVCL